LQLAPAIASTVVAAVVCCGWIVLLLALLLLLLLLSPSPRHCPVRRRLAVAEAQALYPTDRLGPVSASGLLALCD